MSDTPDLTDRQKEVLGHLPASKSELADALRVKPTTIEGHLDRIEAKGVDIAYDRDANQWFIADERSGHLRRLSTQTKQSITRKASELIEEEQAVLFRRLRRTDPLKADPVEKDGHETFGAIISDTHFGDVVEKEYWDAERGEYVTDEVYNMDTAGEAVTQFGREILKFKEFMPPRFDDIFLFVLGDVATGTEIYELQGRNVQAPLNEQVETSVAALYQLCVTLAENFETVQVRGIPGNHGTDKPSAAIGANTDLLTYSWVDDRLRDSGYDNIDVRYSQTHEYLNTSVRGWRFHVRHGHSELEHIDETAASARDWRGLRDEFQFDAAMKGHHHSPSYHKVMNRYPVFAAPSPKPGGEFPSKIGKPDVSKSKDLGWVFGISDDRPVTWQFLVDDQ